MRLLWYEGQISKNICVCLLYTLYCIIITYYFGDLITVPSVVLWLWYRLLTLIVASWFRILGASFLFAVLFVWQLLFLFCVCFAFVLIVFFNYFLFCFFFLVFTFFLFLVLIPIKSKSLFCGGFIIFVWAFKC